jgi:hypothetical protein
MSLIDLCALNDEESMTSYWKGMSNVSMISVEEELAKAYFRVKTLCASIREKYDQPWVLSKILEYNVDKEEWDDSEEDTNLDEVLPPKKQIKKIY